MIKLAPSILSADFTRLGEEIKVMEKNSVEYLHIDVMDGIFVNNISIGVPVVKSISEFTDMVKDVHLMITKPERYVEAFAKAGADIINFHLEATENPSEVISLIKSFGKRAAITIKPYTPYQDVLEYLADVEMVLIMGVEPGFGGQSLIEHSLENLKAVSDYIKENNLNTLVEIDGGINSENFAKVVELGADIVVVGSALFKTGDLNGEIQRFNKIIEECEK